MKVCFLGTNILNALEGKVAGGAERQQALIIEGLKSIGVEVIVLEYYLKSKKNVNGINIYPAWDIKKTSFISRLQYIRSNLKKNKVDIVYIRGTQLYGAFLFLFQKFNRNNLKLFWGIAGDHDLTSKFNYLRNSSTTSIYEKINSGFLFNLSSNLLYFFSDHIICQTSAQIKRCNYKWKKKPVTLISNIFPKSNNVVDNIKRTEYDAIWIGKFSGIKGEDILLKIAKDIPEMKILCLGHVERRFENTALYQQIKRQRNIYLKGRVSHSKVTEYIAKSDFVLNTSPSEGLSNVFLEGWNLKKPTISFTVNPNEYLTKGEAGYCAENSYSDLSSKLKIIINNINFLTYHGVKGKEILINHFPENIIPKYYKLFLIK